MGLAWTKAVRAAVLVAAGVTVTGASAVGQTTAIGQETIISDRAVGELPGDVVENGALELPIEQDDGSSLVEPSVEPDDSAGFEPAEGLIPGLFDPAIEKQAFTGGGGHAHAGSCCCKECCKVQCQDSPGLIQVCRHKYKARWTARLDALLLWRNAPRERTIFSAWNPETDELGDPVIGASDLESTMGAGPRISLFRTDCDGHTAEFTYFQAFNFLAEEATAPSFGGYAIGPGSIYGNTRSDLDAATVDLTSGIKSFEVNGRKCVTRNISLLGGFRWVEWRESLSILDRFDDEGLADDLYGTSTMNSLYGGQIGFDARLWDRGWLRIDTVMKGGAYYNLAVQQSSYRVRPLGGDADLVGRTWNEAGPAAFVGELGFMGTIPITNHFEFTFGYLGLWLESIAQPTGQLGGQTIVDGTSDGDIDTTGGTVLQGVTLGFNARW